MARRASFCAGILLASTVASAAAGERRPLREAESENHAFMLRIEPGRPDRGKPQSCSGVLFAVAREAGGERKRWERPLVNDVAPAAAAVRDDGRFVVTLGEFRRGGARHALVIYGERGQLLRHFVLSDLLGRDDWQHVRTSRRAIDWLDGAEYGFGEPDEFVIELRSRRTITIDLKGLRVVRDGAGAAAGDGEIPADVLSLLSDGGDERAARLAVLAEKMGTTPENLERLIAEGYVDPRKLDEVQLDDDPLVEAEPAPDDALPQKPADEPAAVAAAEAGAAADALHDAADDEATSPADPPAAPAEAPADAVLPLPPPPPGADPAATGISIPPPDPAHPVNYIDWLNALAVTDGPNAAPDIEAAIAAFQPWEGDQDLFDAAMAGDPAALADPALQGWLNANQPALEHVRTATTKEFAGWQMHSEDGSMIGVLLPTLAPQRQLARTAVMDGRRLEAAGDYEGAAGRYLETLAAGAQAGQGPTLIENLVGVAVQNLAAEALLDLPTRAPDGSLDYVALAEEAEAAYRPVRPMHESVQFERAFMMDSLQRVFQPRANGNGYEVRPDEALKIFSMIGSDPGGGLETLAGLARLNYDDTIAQANAYYDALAEAARLPYPEARGYMGELEQHLEGAAQNNIMIRTLTPALSRAHFIKTRAETQRRASLLVTNLMAYRQQHGQLPDSLAAFGGREFVTDPFSGLPFTYRREGNDFVLYSLGDNGVDDGGIHDPKTETNDVVYWPRPPK